MNSNLPSDNRRRVRGMGLSNENGSRRLDDCVVNRYSLLGACNSNSDCSIAGIESTWQTGTALNCVSVFCSWFVEAGIS